MRTKILGVVAMLVGSSPFLFAVTNDLSGLVGKGLFEEEANHNLAGAEQAYQAAIENFDTNRQLAATAIFRLGECYRKEGNTNAAAIQYQRILREFADQTDLAKLCEGYVGKGPGIIALGTATVSPLSSTLASLENEYAQSLAKARSLKTAYQTVMSDKGTEATYFSVVKSDQILQSQLLGQSQASNHLVELSLNFGPDNPQVREQKAILKQNESIISNRLQQLEQGLKLEAQMAEQDQKDLEAQIQKTKDLMSADVGGGRVSRAPHQSGASAESSTGAAETINAEGAEISKINEMLQNNPDLINRSHGQTLLRESVQNGWTNAVKLLLDHGPNMDLTGALNTAVDSDQLPMIEFLLSRGANVNTVTSGDAPLWSAAMHDYTRVAESLIRHGAAVNIHRVSDGNTPLHTAVNNGFFDMAALLIRKGADVNATNNKGEAPLLVAGHTNMIQLLISNKANVNMASANGDAPLSAQIRARNVDNVKLLLENGAETESQTFKPILTAIQTRRNDLVDMLLAHHANPNSRSTESGRTNFTPLIGAVIWANSDPQIAQNLLDHGADPNLVDSYGMSALHDAVWGGTVELVRLLLAHHCDVNLADDFGKPPIAYIRNFPRGAGGSPGGPSPAAYQEIKTLLLKAGANEDYKRLSDIFITQAGSGSIGQPVFTRGTNSYNHYTVLDVIARAYHEMGVGVQFPDLAHLTINRLKGSGKTEDLAVDLDALIQSGDCSRDVPLQWGDVVEIPQKDHPINEQWPGFSEQVASSLKKCLRRTVEIIVKGKTNNVELSPLLPYTSALPPSKENSDSALHRFDLDGVIHQSQLLLLSSDLSRVKVTRRNPAVPEHPQIMQFDLTRRTPPELWLRDGDVIEIPERNPNTAAE